MTLLNSLGLLGLLGIVVLIIIYIIKPNYQQKFVSSTFIWKLSLKYRKKKIPTSKLRNFLLILCQILILTACALILAKPVQVLSQPVQEKEVIIILDSSASMRTALEEETRFEKAVSEIIDFSEDIFRQNGLVSVVLADAESGFLTNETGFSAQRLQTTQKETLKTTLTALLDTTDGDISCAYGASDVDGAIALCEEVLVENPSAEIYFYTDTAYSYVPEKIYLVNLAQADEWNVAILDTQAAYEENYYSFYVDVAAYGRDMEVDVMIEVHGANAMDANDSGATLAFSKTVTLSGEQTTQVMFIDSALYESMETPPEKDNAYIIGELNNNERITSYKDVYIYVEVADSFRQDNSMYIYGGQKEALKVQYASSSPNSFFHSILLTLKSAYANRWDMQISEVKKGGEPETEGFDFYIFEHAMPDPLPTDGIVLLVNPGSAPTGSDMRIEGEYDFRKQSVSLTEEESHPLLKNVTADNITVSKYVVGRYEPSYKVLLSCDTNPVLLMKDDGPSKVLVMGFSLHFSNLPILKEFPLLMNNIFEYYLPSTVKGNSFEVNEKVSLNARGEELTVSRVGDTLGGATYNEFPASLNVNIPGTYMLKQITDFGKEIEESIYVKIPASESNIRDVKEALDAPYVEERKIELYNDLLIYLAAALVALLFIEWWLQSRDNM